MNERMKRLRKTLDLTQQEFANRLGVARNNIAGYETGKRSPSDAVISLICREFNVKENWLRTGEGDMLEPALTNTLDSLTQEFNLSKPDRIAIEKFINLSPGQRNVILDYVLSIAASLDNTSAATLFDGIPDTPEEMERLYPPVDLNETKGIG